MAGTWGSAIEVPGTAALNKGGAASIASVSCATAGNCSAGGRYVDGSGHSQVFVTGETNGSWGTAKEVPGTAALNTGGNAGVSSVSCASAGNCSAGGVYASVSTSAKAFVVSQTGGTWGTAKEVPGTAAPGKHEGASLYTVSCASAGNCSAGGYYYFKDPVLDQAFVVSQTHGAWGTAEEVPGTAALNKGKLGSTDSVSCASAGNCSAGGDYLDASGHEQVFVVSESGGTWGTAKEVPGSAALNAGGYANMDALSCASAGDCSAGGLYKNASGHGQAFIVSQTGGAWGTAEEVPGTAALNKGRQAELQSVSCAPAGNCSAGGFYTDAGGRAQAFVVHQS